MRWCLIICVVAFHLAISKAKLSEVGLIKKMEKLSPHQKLQAAKTLKNCANNFSLKFYQASAKNDYENNVLATYQIFTSMAMASFGAGNEIRELIRHNLEFPTNMVSIRAGLESIRRSLKATEDTTNLFSLTNFERAENVSLKSNYELVIERVFDLVPEENEFRSHDAVAFHNEMALTCNLVPQPNKDGLLFYNNATSQAYTTESLRLTGKHRYGELSNLDAKFVEIPCLNYIAMKNYANINEMPERKNSEDDVGDDSLDDVGEDGGDDVSEDGGDDITMFFVLPNADFGLEKLEENILKLDVNEFFSAGLRDVDVLFPIRNMSRFDDVKEDLSRMGLGEMFSNNSVYNRMTEGVDVKIETLRNGAIIDVVEMSDVSPAPPVVGDDTIKITVSHPFIAIVTTKSENPLIIGMVRWARFDMDV